MFLLKQKRKELFKMTNKKWYLYKKNYIVHRIDSHPNDGQKPENEADNKKENVH